MEKAVIIYTLILFVLVFNLTLQVSLIIYFFVNQEYALSFLVCIWGFYGLQILFFVIKHIANK